MSLTGTFQQKWNRVICQIFHDRERLCCFSTMYCYTNHYGNNGRLKCSATTFISVSVHRCSQLCGLNDVKIQSFLNTLLNRFISKTCISMYQVVLMWNYNARLLIASDPLLVALPTVILKSSGIDMCKPILYDGWWHLNSVSLWPNLSPWCDRYIGCVSNLSNHSTGWFVLRS